MGISTLPWRIERSDTRRTSSPDRVNGKGKRFAHEQAAPTTIWFYLGLSELAVQTWPVKDIVATFTADVIIFVCGTDVTGAFEGVVARTRNSTSRLEFAKPGECGNPGLLPGTGWLCWILVAPTTREV